MWLYQVGLAAERPTHWGDDLWTLHADLGECKTAVANLVADLTEKLGADQVRFALSCSTEEGYRRELCPTYKANRKNNRKPVVHGALREHLEEAYDTIRRDRLEADDILGILATQPTDERRIIVSVDKDYNGVPCLFYKTNEENPEVRQVTAEQALRFHALQTLMGDRVDGYVGIPGVGIKTAEKMLANIDTKDLWPAIVAAYAKEGLSESVALTNARLARILQHGDYNTVTGAINLWTPPAHTNARKKNKSKSTAPSQPASQATKPSASAS